VHPSWRFSFFAIGETFRPESAFVPFHGNAPRLSYVNLDDVVIGWSSSLLRDLVGFELHLCAVEMDMRPSWVEFSTILRGSPRLTSLTLSWSVLTEPFTDWQDEPIELPSLEYLALSNEDCTDVPSLFRLLSMPNLKKLSLHLRGREPDNSEFIRQLATPPRSVLSGLQHLKITNGPCDSSSINAMYEQLTNLESIYLDSISTDRLFLTTLIESFSGTLYCPNLTKITTRAIPGDEMRSFIAMRGMARIPVKRLAMNEHDALNEEDERWLRENVQSFGRFRWNPA
jgi:hypothetical protein